MKRRPENHTMRPITLVLFVLIALAVLPGSSEARRRPVGPVLLAAAVPAANAAEPVWLTPQTLAGLAALVAALADGTAKIVLSFRRDVSAEACPFATGGVARCHGSPKPIPSGT